MQRVRQNTRTIKQMTKRLAGTATTTTTKKPLPPKWPVPHLDSHGDYLSDAKILEPAIPGPLYSRQHTLPRLPIPELSTTLSKFLPTALPLCQSDEERATLLENASSFPSQALTLQTRLRERAAGAEDTSWLQCWWNTLMYLRFRETVVINVSYFFHFADDCAVGDDNGGDGDEGDRQIRRAATLLTSAAAFRREVCSGSLPPEKIGKGGGVRELCMVGYKYMFHACRIPRSGGDSYKIYDPSLHRHVIVICDGRFFSFDFLNAEGDVASLEVLEKRLRRCRELAAAARREKGGGEIGWLTGWHRDEWANAREVLLDVGGEELSRALEVLESGVLAICLDDETPRSRDQCGNLFLHGNVSSSHNRWFDKSIQLIVTKNGKAGLTGEHSMMDGMPVVNFVDHLTKLTYREAKAASHSGSDYYKDGDVVDIFEKCEAILNHERVAALVKKAKNDLSNYIQAHTLSSLAFHGYGSNYIKKSKFSPDAYIQMAMQLATYRLFSTPAATYEATQVRPYLHGRTETTRTVSPSSSQFSRLMGLYPKGDEHDPTKRHEKLDALRRAVAEHIAYIRDASRAEGVDRHFLGLSLLVGDDETAPDLFSHPVFRRSKSWRVSTSHLSHPRFVNWGYGEVVPDGVGLSYMIRPDACVFNVTALKKGGGEGGREEQWPERLTFLLEEALLEMKTLIEFDRDAAETEDGVVAAPRSKL